MVNKKSVIFKGVLALVLVFTSLTTLVAYAASTVPKKVTVTDADKTFEVSTNFETAEEILSENNISVTQDDKVTLSFENGKGQLTVMRAFPVHITFKGKTVDVNITKCTVAEAIKKAGIETDEFDVCNKKSDEIISSETFLDIVDVEYVTDTYDERIYYQSTTEYSSKLNKGEVKVKRKGSEGVRSVTVKKKMENGVETGREIITSTVSKEAVDEILLVGTKEVKTKTTATAKSFSKKSSATTKTNNNTSGAKVVETISKLGKVAVDSKGVPLSYSKKMTVKATAYSEPAGAHCSTGVAVQPGYIAVNPKVIPYGTKMYIVSNDGKYVYGYAIAADTGGFAKNNPNSVDLFFNTNEECRKFGTRNVTIYFIK